MRVEPQRDRIRVISAQKTCEVRLGVGWESISTAQKSLGGPEWPCHESRVVEPSGAVRLPQSGVSVVDANGEETRVGSGEERTVTPAETVVCYAPVPTLVSPETGNARLSVADDTTPKIDADRVAVSWSTPPDPPVTELRIDRSAESVAAAVSASTVALPEVLSPARTWSNSRAAAPVWCYDRGVPPESVDWLASGVRLVVPDDDDSLGYVLAVSTLAYYLAAEIDIQADAADTHLVAAGETWRMGESPDAVDRTASQWLRRVFYLDCLARCGGRLGTRLQEADAALAFVDGDAASLFQTPLRERVRRYLAADDGVDDVLPRWPEATHVKPHHNRVPRVSQWLGRLSDVRLPRQTELVVGDLDAWDPDPGVEIRGSSTEGVTPLVVPSASGDVAVVGWDAPGTPLGAYDAGVGRPPEPTPAPSDPVRVAVVRTGYQSTDGAASQWKRRADDMALEIDMIDRPDTSRLSEILRDRYDLVHIGSHNESGEGVECADGYLPADDLREVAATLVVANCCDAENWARAAVDAGANAAAAPTGPIKISAAERDGRDLARLLGAGWCIERAVDHIRQATDVSGWLVCGDGGVRVGQTDSPSPPRVVFGADGVDDGQVRYSHLSPGVAGHRVTDMCATSPRLPGTRTMSVDDLREELGTLESAIQTDEGLVWPDEF